ncbi:MAG: hypothetical protein K2P55_13480 [Bacteroides acidifaciens]|uniref:hypothetical protein n=1 Tax=Bacteroides acidifaciens TaxID=85831 RepID=UPI0023CD9C8F|nr:hypothetical protein [Bacteroides acidifaciens]MDE6822695.1 hypothetical protein [Bacteroides acidifaciens]MDE6987890.1 hypothetical protein [Bacteroides acidifaciens]
MKQCIILSIFLLSTIHALAQPAISKQEIINGDTIVWINEEDNYTKKANSNNVKIYVTEDQVVLPSIQGSADPMGSISYIVKRMPFREDYFSNTIISLFTLEEIQYLLHSNHTHPIWISFSIDTKGEINNIKFFINQDIAYKFSSHDIYRIRNYIKNNFGFKQDPNYKSYNYMLYTLPISKKRISSILKQIIGNMSLDNNSSNERRH